VAKIEVPKALRSDMEAPKALNDVESREGRRKRILAHFLVTEHFW